MYNVIIYMTANSVSYTYCIIVSVWTDYGQDIVSHVAVNNKLFRVDSVVYNGADK